MDKDEDSKEAGAEDNCFNDEAKENQEMNRLEMTLLNMLGKLPDNSNPQLQSAQKYAVSDDRDHENINMVKLRKERGELC